MGTSLSSIYTNKKKLGEELGWSWTKCKWDDLVT